MATLQEQQQQVRQQIAQAQSTRNSLEEQRRRLESSRTARGVTNLNQLAQRQRNLAAVGQQVNQVSAAEVELQSVDREISQAIEQENRQKQKQEALRILVEKGKGSQYLYNLPAKERTQIREIASEIKRQQQKMRGMVAVDAIQQKYLMSLSPDVEKKVFTQGAVGEIYIDLPKRTDIQISQSTQSFYSPIRSQVKYNANDQVSNQVYQSIPQYTSNNKYSGPTQRFQDEDYFRYTGKYKQAPLVVSAAPQVKANGLTSNIITEKNIRAAALRDGLVVGTPAYENYIDREIAKSKAAESIIGAGALSLVGVPEVPAVIKGPLREVKNPFFVEVKRPTISAQGEEGMLSVYQTVKERVPPTVTLDSTKGGGFLGKDSLFIKAPKYQLERTLIPAVDKGKVLTINTNTGKTGMLSTLEGASKKINPQDISKLPKPTRYLFDKMTAGPKGSTVIDDSFEYSIGGVSKNRLGSGLPEKQTSNYFTASKTRQLKETDAFKLFETEIFFKEASPTGAVSRASGKTPSMRGIIKVLKEPLDLRPAGSEVKFIKPNPNIKKTPLSTTFQELEVTQTAKVPPKATSIKNVNLIKPASSVKGYGKLGVLSGSVNRLRTRSDSSFASEFVRGFKSANPVEKAKAQSEDQLDLPKESQASFESLGLNQKNNQLTIKIPKQSPLEISRESQPEVTAQGTPQIQTPIPFLGLGSSLQLIPRVPQKPKNPLKPGNPKLPTRPFLPKLPKPGGPIFSSPKEPELGFDRVTPEVKRFGKYRPLPSEPSLEAALRKTSRLVDINLGRSARFRSSSGKLIDLGSVSLPRGFRLGKRDRGVLVEESRYALSTSGETGEIQYFKRKTKKGRKNIFGM